MSPVSASVLDELLAAARQRSRADARVAPLAELRREVRRLPTARRFEATLRSADRVSVIAEAKRESPSAGTFDLGPGSSAVTALARRYADAGAAALSVLTEPTRFGGSDHDLVAAARIGLPVLRKVLGALRAPRPNRPPRGFPVWPLWFAAVCFVHVRRAGGLLVVGLGVAAVSGWGLPLG